MPLPEIMERYNIRRVQGNDKPRYQGIASRRATKDLPMRFLQSALSRVAAGLLINMPFSVQATTVPHDLAQTVAADKLALDWRVGVIVLRAGQEPIWASRGGTLCHDQHFQSPALRCRPDCCR